jgi:MFS family permease
MIIEFPAGLLLRRYHPRYVIGLGAIFFGIFATTVAAAKSYAAVMILRVLLGLAEAFANNAYLYISFWYKAEELSTRTGMLTMFFSQARTNIHLAAIYGMTPVAGAVSGLIAYGVQKHLDQSLGYAAWQWLFIIEGGTSIFFALFIIALLPALPDTVAERGSVIFKHEDERRLISARIAEGT